jgi:hypothetical protein
VELTKRSDYVADLLDEGDSCAAKREAQRLQGDAIAAINAGRVPGRYQEEVLGDVAALAETIPCPPAGDEAKSAAAARSLSRKLRAAAVVRST